MSTLKFWFIKKYSLDGDTAVKQILIVTHFL
jgi:hypothetical protein